MATRNQRLRACADFDAKMEAEDGAMDFRLMLLEPGGTFGDNGFVVQGEAGLYHEFGAPDPD